jgi:hypothetical protein
MKNVKFLFILFVSMMAFAANAQISFTSPATLTNAATAYSTRTINGPARSLSIQMVVTKTSGTVAGTASLEGSHDGTNYASISASTFTLTDVASQNFIWNLAPAPVPYYRVKFVTTGTMVAVPAVTAVVRK